MTARTRSYEHLRRQHPSVVYELVYQVELDLRGTSVPAQGPERDAYLQEVRRRREEASDARVAGTEAMIALLERWDRERPTA